MGFCSCVNKLFLFALNFIVFAVGVTVIALASVVIHRGSEYSGLLFDGILTLPIWTLLVGIIITVLGFFGCCGALKEHSCMLYTYASIVSVLLIAEVTLGVLVVMYPSEASEHIKEGMEKAFRKYNVEGDTALDKSIDSMQYGLKCCGVDGIDDWATFPYGKVPDTCCVVSSPGCTGPYNENGCFDSIVMELKGVTMALGIAAIVLAIVQVMCVCIACALGKRRSMYV